MAKRDIFSELIEGVDALKAERKGMLTLRQVKLQSNIDAHRKLASLDADPEVEQAWELEADRRDSELADGTSVPIPSQEAITRPRSKLT